MTGSSSTAVAHRYVDVDGVSTFYREAGPPDAPVVLLPHGYPSSSFQYRRLMPALADRWRVLAPDQPGFGHTATPADFDYTFDAHASFLQRFTEVLELSSYALYLHDFGSQFGFRLAVAAPERVTALVIQNGDIYEDEHGPKYAPLKQAWALPAAERWSTLVAAVTQESFRDEFVGEIPAGVVDRVSPDTWTLAWAQLGTPERREHLATLLADQPSTVPWFERQQEYLRKYSPPTLIVWGPHDGYMPEAAARAYLRDLPDAELHLLDGGHWLLETHPDELAALCRDFLGRVHDSA